MLPDSLLERPPDLSAGHIARNEASDFRPDWRKKRAAPAHPVLQHPRPVGWLRWPHPRLQAGHEWQTIDVDKKRGW